MILRHVKGKKPKIKMINFNRVTEKTKPNVI